MVGTEKALVVPIARIAMAAATTKTTLRRFIIFIFIILVMTLLVIIIDCNVLTRPLLDMGGSRSAITTDCYSLILLPTGSDDDGRDIWIFHVRCSVRKLEGP